MAKSEQSPAIAARARRWFRRVWPDADADARRAVAQRLYRDLVKQARTPVFYREVGVPDTPEGRFEMIGLHADVKQFRANKSLNRSSVRLAG